MNDIVSVERDEFKVISFVCIFVVNVVVKNFFL